MRIKRSLIVVLVALLALSSLGILTANAAPAAQDDEDPTPWLGITIRDTDDGVMITSVLSDSPAEDAGLEVDWLIVAVDGTAVASSAELIELVQGYAVGDEITLTVNTGDGETDVTATLAELSAGYHRERPRQEMMHLNFLGMATELTDEGLLVKEVAPESPVGQAGLLAGDIITAINGEPVTERGLAGPMVSIFRVDQPTVFTVLRDGEEIEIEVDLELQIIEGTPFDGELQIMPVMPRGGLQLGVTFQTITPDLAAEHDLAVDHGALIMEVIEDSPAAAAGLQAGDIITAVGDDQLDEERTLRDRLYAYEEGDVVTLTILRDLEIVTIDVTLGPKGANFGMRFNMEPGTGMFFFGPDGEQGMFDFGPHMGEDGHFFEWHHFGDDGADDSEDEADADPDA